MKIKFLIICASAILLFSYCSGNNSETELIENQKVYYFDFDEVDHYNVKISESDVYPLYDDTLNKESILKLDILQSNFPKDINDTVFLTKVEKMGFKKTDIPISKYEDLKELFREKTHDPNCMHWMCMPIYRDILVFRKKGAISGIAKICFECDLEYFAGTTANTTNFCSFGAHQKLSTLLFD